MHIVTLVKVEVKHQEIPCLYVILDENLSGKAFGNITDAARHLAGQRKIVKLDCPFDAGVDYYLDTVTLLPYTEDERATFRDAYRQARIDEFLRPLGVVA